MTGKLEAMTAYNLRARHDESEDLREEVLDAISIDGRRVALAINDRPGIVGYVFPHEEDDYKRWTYAWFFGRKLKMHDLGLHRLLYLGADGHVYRLHISDVNHWSPFKRAQIEKRKTLEGVKRIHEAILRLAE